MIDSKKKIIVMVVFTFLLCASVIAITAFVFVKQENPEPKIRKKVAIKTQQKKKRPVVTSSEIIAPRSDELLTEEEKKKKLANEFKEAREELRASFQGSKMQKLIQKRLFEKKKAYLSDLFEKHGIDEEAQDAVVHSFIDGQMQIRDLMRSSQYYADRSEEKRVEIGEKLALIQDEMDNQIKQIAGDGFFNDATEKQSASIRGNYIKRIGRSLKMSDEQKNELDELYSSTQTSFVERFTLPKYELDSRTETFQNGIKEILTEEQYAKYKKGK